MATQSPNLNAVDC